MTMIYYLTLHATGFNLVYCSHGERENTAESTEEPLLLYISQVLQSKCINSVILSVMDSVDALKNQCNTK